MADDKGEDVWDSWEDMVDSGGLDKRLEKEEQTLQETRKKEEPKTNQPIVLEEDTHRTKYQPQLKLMRRQNDAGYDDDQQDAAQKGKTMAKSLAEREAEYAQARLRILGSVKNEDEEKDRSLEPPRALKTSSNSSQSKKQKGKTTSKKGSSAKR